MESIKNFFNKNKVGLTKANKIDDFSETGIYKLNNDVEVYDYVFCEHGFSFDYCVAKLKLPSGAIVVVSKNHKLRTDKAEIVEIKCYDNIFNELKNCKRCYPIYNDKIKYFEGAKIYADVDTDTTRDHASGINFIKKDSILFKRENN